MQQCNCMGAHALHCCLCMPAAAQCKACVYKAFSDCTTPRARAASCSRAQGTGVSDAMMCDRSRRDPSPSSALSRYDKRRSSFLISWLLRLRETEHGANGLWNAVERDREGRQEGMASPLLLAAVIDQHARDPTVLQGSPKQCTAWAWPCAVNCERRRRSIHAAFDAGLRMRTPFFNGETTGREALSVFFIGDEYPEALNFFLEAHIARVVPKLVV